MLALPAHLTLSTAQSVLDSFIPQLDAAAGPSVTIDASALTQIDTSTLAVLLACRRRAVAAQRGFSVHRPPARLVELARLYGVQDLLALQG